MKEAKQVHLTEEKTKQTMQTLYVQLEMIHKVFKNRLSVSSKTFVNLN